MRGFQIFSTSIIEVPPTFRKYELNSLTTKNSKPINDTIYVNLKKAEKALSKYKSNVFKCPNTNEKGFTTFAEAFYLVELEFDKETNKVDHYICVWAYAPYRDKENIDNDNDNDNDW